MRGVAMIWVLVIIFVHDVKFMGFCCTPAFQEIGLGSFREMQAV
jgi:hypothetical protein